MIVTSIIDNGTTIQLTVDGAKKEVQKDGLLVDIIDTEYIRLYLPNARNFNIKFSDVVTPAAATIDALRAAIKVMIDATTANNLLQQIADNTDQLELKADTVILNTDGLESQIANLEVAIGDPPDAEATSDTGSFSLISFEKRKQTKLTTLNEKDFATQATLLQIKNTIDNIEETVVLINGHSGPSASSSNVVIGNPNGAGQAIVDVNNNLQVVLKDGAGTAITNTAGSLDVNITGGTVDTTLLATEATLLTLLKPADTLSAVTNLSQLNGAAISMGTGVRDAGTQRVTIATDDSVPITGTVTVDTSLLATAANQTNETQQTGTFGGNTDASTNISIAGWTVSVSTVVIAANSNRRGISITNGTNKTVLLRVGGTLTSANYTVSLAAGGLYEVPQQLSRLAINGMFTGAAPAASGNLILTIANK